MLKKVLMVLMVLVVMLDAKNMKRMKQVESGETRQIAVENAYWNMFEDALGKTIGSASYDGSIVGAFKSDYNKDFRTFKRTHFKNAKEKCNDNGIDGFECLVIASMDLDRMRKLYSKKSNSDTALGKKHKISNLKVILIDNVDNKISEKFNNELQSFSNNSGTSLTIGTKSIKSKTCKSLKQKYKEYKRKGRGYKKAADSAKEKLDMCEKNIEENKNADYAFILSSLELEIDPKKDSYGAYNGEITYMIYMLNTQTGKRENAIPGETVSTFAKSISKLKSKLTKKAANLANTEMNNNMLSNTAKKKRNKQDSKFKKFEYVYTLIARGLTTDRDDAPKRKGIKATIKELGSKIKHNPSESQDSEQVFNFGSNEEYDLLELSDMLYDMADTLGFRIHVSAKSEDVILLQFQ